MDIAINVYVWNHKDSSNSNQKKKTAEAVRAQTYTLQDNRGKNKGLYCSRVSTLHLFFQGSASSGYDGVYFCVYESLKKKIKTKQHYYLKC